MRAELHKSLVADEKIHELLRFTISTNVKKDVEQPRVFKAVARVKKGGSRATRVIENGPFSWPGL